MQKDIVILERKATPEDVAFMDQYFNRTTNDLGIPSYIGEDFGLQIRSPQDELIANLHGKISWNWMTINILWVHPEHERQGIGSALMSRAEEMARAKQLTGSYLWTASWQAEGFYKKLGYEEFTRFDNFPPGHTRFGFRKYL
jgi:GNAT superfamily N-acetyltransferase